MPFEVAFQNFHSWPQSVIIPDATPKNYGVMTPTQAAKLAGLTPGGSGEPVQASDFAFGPASWGATATITDVEGTTDGFDFTVATSGGSQDADPSVDLTFPEGGFADKPFYIVELSACDDAGTLDTKITWTSTLTTLHINFNGTPADNKNYTFTAIRGS